MIIKIYQVDAFCEDLFSGNPAAVCPLESWLEDEVLQNIAMENNLSETAFYIPLDSGYQLRWFTPTTEVDLCGHATLATAHVLLDHETPHESAVTFQSLSGPLEVKKNNDQYQMNFPADQLKAIPVPDPITQLGIDSLAVFQGRDDYLCIVDRQRSVENLQLNMETVAQLDSRGLIVSAAGEDCDFVSRCFFPQAGVDEDPVTGSAHTTMTPYWAQQLGKNQMVARQLSARGGQVNCTLVEDRVLLGGQAKTYMIGHIFI